MARSKAAKETAERERNKIKAQLRAAKEVEASQNTEKEDIGRSIASADETKGTLIEAFSHENWTVADENGVIVAILEQGENYEAGKRKATKIVAEVGFTRSWGIRPYRSAEAMHLKA